MRFAFYGRVSTEDQQDPESSRAWQLSRANALIEPHDGLIVAEFFDIGQSRSLPWARRPRAAALLAALARPDREFDAVVIGEPQRAFYGNQFGLTFPLFVHYGVQLWVPEVGGPLDPDNEAHDLVMSVFGGMSKGERNRIKLRVRTAMATQTKIEGRFLGGRPPYGYLLVDAGRHPNPGKAAIGAQMHRLDLDPQAAPVVARIFARYLEGRGIYAIAEELTRDGIACPSAHDPARNRHRSGVAWSKMAVRAILTNPRYTGRQVWNRQRRDEVLIDINDVALGHQTRQRWNTEGDWIWSTQPTHEALVTDADFRRVQAQLAARATTRQPVATVKRTRHPYQLRGLIFCGLCERRMQGSWNNGRPHYRCVYPTEYGLANHTEHPRSVYIRQDLIVPRLDQWLSRAFGPDQLTHTIRAMADAQTSGDDDTRRATQVSARQILADCDRRLARYRAALEAGTDPALIATWTAEVNAERAAAEVQLRATRPRPRMTADEIDTLVRGLGSVLAVLRDADPLDKAEIYRKVGLRLTYQPGENKMIAEARPPAIMYEGSCRRGDLNPHAR